MANRIKVNTRKLGTDAETVRMCISNMKKQITQLQQQVSQLDSMWDGQSSEAFKKAVHDDIKSLDVIFSNLEKIYKYEAEAKKSYESCEKKVGSAVTNIKV